MTDQLQLELDGSNYTGWKSVTLNRSIESLSGSFNISLIDQEGSASRRITEGSDVVVWLADPALGIRTEFLTGFIDTIKRNESATATSMSTTGRDRTADLIDCSIERKSSTWKNIKFSKLVESICNPFSISVDSTALLDDPVIEEFTYQVGESAFQSIERLCRAFAVLPITNRQGVLVLTYAGLNSAVDVLELGKNLKNISETRTWLERHSIYTGKGQQGNRGKKWSKRNTQLKAVAFDSEVTRFRPLVFLKEGKSSDSDLKSRVFWEAQVRAGRSIAYKCTVQGWFQTGGLPWDVNQIATIRADKWDVDKELLITSTAFSIDEGGGHVTELTLKSPETYRAEPTSEVFD